MPLGFAAIPDAPRYVLRNARVPSALLDMADAPASIDDLCGIDITIADGRIAGLDRPGGATARLPPLDLKSGIVFPGFVDVHTHLDKGHIWPRRRNPDGTFLGALETVKLDRKAHWTADDVLARMRFSLRSAYAHGTVAIRTHIDSAFGQEDITWAIVPEIREEWADRITLQFSSLASCDLMADDAFTAKLGRIVAKAGGLLGCVTYASANLAPALEHVFRTAMAHGLDLDFHVDETQDPASRSLAAIADKALEVKFPGRILVGHCCSLTRQAPPEQAATIARLAEAKIAVVSLPMCNMYLQEREAGKTPRFRGITLLHELKAAGVPVAVASDNTRDPFYAYGDLDALEVYREATRIAHLDHPVGDWPKAITATPAAIMGLTERGVVRVGAPADLVLCRGRSWTELLSRPQADRTVLRHGRAIDTTPPDYAELDPIVGAP